MNITFKNMTWKEIENVSYILQNWKKHYLTIKPFQKVTFGKCVLWNTKAGNITVTKK